MRKHPDGFAADRTELCPMPPRDFYAEGEIVKGDADKLLKALQPPSRLANSRTSTPRN
jgi:hypothetical protein